MFTLIFWESGLRKIPTTHPQNTIFAANLSFFNFSHKPRQSSWEIAGFKLDNLVPILNKSYVYLKLSVQVMPAAVVFEVDINVQVKNVLSNLENRSICRRHETHCIIIYIKFVMYSPVLI